MSTTGPNQKKSPYHLPGGLTVIISAAAAATAGPPRRDRQPARLPRPLVLSASSSLLRWHRQRSSLSSSTSTSTRVKRAVQGCPAGVPQTSWEPCRHHHHHGGLHGSTTTITAAKRVGGRRVMREPFQLPAGYPEDRNLFALDRWAILASTAQDDGLTRTPLINESASASGSCLCFPAPPARPIVLADVNAVLFFRAWSPCDELPHRR
ncbi:hypothetical protein PCL_09887 [Purpureocillium lilacinum]|uniref:Uncharacterized protein n=1 Tax=Purpureocillium lilacinum TaxID=33203 RepID=A0A2U3EEG5_PURLI|nr:hypothetical protein PCL_09887 [Purpureocillium lilacinum]